MTSGYIFKVYTQVKGWLGTGSNRRPHDFQSLPVCLHAYRHIPSCVISRSKLLKDNRELRDTT
jgi:hypothetical protein